MSQEVEAAAGAALGSFFRRKKHREELPIGAPCPNCATPLEGPWCYSCGQLAEDFHRSTWKLLAEAFEGMVHFDSRLWNTLPDLLRHPARLTNTFLEGHRAPQIPPFRLFLVVLVLVFFAGTLGEMNPGQTNTVVMDAQGHVLSKSAHSFRNLSPTERADIAAQIQKGAFQVPARYSSAAGWLKSRVINTLNDPARFQLVLEQWAERFAFLMLPLATALLSLAFIFQRRFYVFDHIIFSLHSLSAVGLMLAVNEVLAGLTAGVTTTIFLIAAPVHLFIHMRGVYRTGVLGTLSRMLFLAVGSVIGAGLIVISLVLIGLNGMGD